MCKQAALVPVIFEPPCIIDGYILLIIPVDNFNLVNPEKIHPSIKTFTPKKNSVTSYLISDTNYSLTDDAVSKNTGSVVTT